MGNVKVGAEVVEGAIAPRVKPEPPEPPPLPGPLLGRQHLTSPVVSVFVIPVVLTVWQGVASGWSFRWVLATCALLIIAAVARVVVWLHRIAQWHKHKHIVTLILAGKISDRVDRLAAENKALRDADAARGDEVARLRGYMRKAGIEVDHGVDLVQDYFIDLRRKALDDIGADRRRGVKQP
jgi:hypothetical protein